LRAACGEPFAVAMFARRPTQPAPVRASAGGPAPAEWLTNPFVGAGGTGFGVLVLLTLCIALFGDPAAGLPSFNAPLTAPGADGIARLRSLLALGQPGVITLDTLQPGADITLEGVSAPGEGGQVVITVPGGGRAGDEPSVGSGRRYAASPLPPAPIAGLSQPSPTGPLPVVAGDGRSSFQAYARPFTADGRPRVAIVIGGLGLNAVQTRAAIERLPAEVTLSFVPYADGLQGWIDLARAQGHEVLLEIPMEPLDYPDNDPGPSTLMAVAKPEETVTRLEWLLSRATGYFGVTNYLGGKFLTSESMVPFQAALKQRGLAFLDDGSGGGTRSSPPGLPRASADRIIDDQLSPESIERQLLALEAAAAERGSALGAGFAYPLTLEQTAKWAESLAQRGFQLAPASAITRR
jgi:uncharacterized protein